MERREKRKGAEKLREERKRREERKKKEQEGANSCECKFFITKRENSYFGLGKHVRTSILVSFLNFVEEFVVSHLGFDNSKFGKTGEVN